MAPVLVVERWLLASALGVAILLGVSSAATAQAPPARVAALPEFRPSDNRPKRDDAKLAGLGIKTYESKRLKLYSDVDPKRCEPIPKLIDAAYDAWVDYFGALPPNRERTEFQMTGYLMSAKAPFREAGLMPADLPDFLNGRHRGAEFWMLDQKHDYYRRHLAIHEATHCYMTILGGPIPPLWYIEGMAELFGTHRLEKDGKVRFRVFPENEADYQGLGRILLMRQEIAAGRGLSWEGVRQLQGNEFLKNEAYAWSWGLCQFLDEHPRYGKRFRELAGNLTYRQFDQVFQRAFGPDAAALRTEWALFAAAVQEGFDRKRAAVEFRQAKPLARDEKRTVDVAADRGWQSSGTQLEAGADYEIVATGRVTLGESPKPWTSEPQGVSLRYFDGHPLGKLLGWIEPPLENGATKTDTTDDKEPASLRRRLDILALGPRTRFRADRSGVLFLRGNDSWNELADNRGHYTVEIRRVPAD